MKTIKILLVLIAMFPVIIPSATYAQFSGSGSILHNSYPPEYKGPKFIIEQIKKIAKTFDLNPNDSLEFAKKLPKLPDGAEGWFAIPSVKALAHNFSVSNFDGERQLKKYGEYDLALRSVLRELSVGDSIYDFSHGNSDGHGDRYSEACNGAPLGSYGHGGKGRFKFRISAEAEKAFKKIGESQKGDIIIIAAQLGIRYLDRSRQEAQKSFKANEFGLIGVAVGSIILTHTERLKSAYIGMVCFGDEYSGDGSTFEDCTAFNWGYDERSMTYWPCTKYPKEKHSLYYTPVASGFLPQ